MIHKTLTLILISIVIISIAIMAPLIIKKCFTPNNNIQSKVNTERNNVLSNSQFHQFGTWISKDKDSSALAIRENTKKGTCFFLGTSEFHHLSKTKYHPSKTFNRSDTNVMCIGSANTRSLWQATMLASVTAKLHPKKIVFLVSPTWFRNRDIISSRFATCFSEGEYLGMILNKKIPVKVKKYIAMRTVQLLQNSAGLQSKVKMYNRLAFVRNNKRNTKLLQQFRRSSDSKTYDICKDAWSKRKKIPKLLHTTKPPNWKALLKDAKRYYLKSSHNQFHMSDKKFFSSVVPVVKQSKNSQKGNTYLNSSEYSDLNVFLAVCHSEKLSVDLIILPVNGFWYKYVGSYGAISTNVPQKVRTIASKYNVRVKNLLTRSCQEGVMMDQVHLAATGWVETNMAAYNSFYRD